jgi:hypothetical protein
LTEAVVPDGADTISFRDIIYNSLLLRVVFPGPSTVTWTEAGFQGRSRVRGKSILTGAFQIVPGGVKSATATPCTCSMITSIAACVPSAILRSSGAVR